MFEKPKQPEQPQTCSAVMINKKTNVSGISVVFSGIGQILFKDSPSAIDFLNTLKSEIDQSTGSVPGKFFSGFRLFYLSQSAQNNIDNIISILNMDK